MSDTTNNRLPELNGAEEKSGANLTRTLIWIGVAGLGAAVAFAAVRMLISRNRPADPTSQRIQQLIDEANSLLKTLDEQRHTA